MEDHPFFYCTAMYIVFLNEYCKYILMIMDTAVKRRKKFKMYSCTQDFSYKRCPGDLRKIVQCKKIQRARSGNKSAMKNLTDINN